MLTPEQRLAMLDTPHWPIDVVIDSDTYNEIDDQFAISYALCNQDKLHVQAIYAAPFLNQRSVSPEDGMVKSEAEIRKLLALIGEERAVYAGSRQFLPDETTPVVSPAAEDLCRRAMGYSPEKPLYVVGLGAITNIASALLIKPEIAGRIVVVWLGGHALEWEDNYEFNLRQDIAAGRVLYQSGAPLVILPAQQVVSSLSTTGPELERWLRGKNPLCDYLVQNTVDEVKSYAEGRAWSRVIWDVAGIAYLLNEERRLMRSRLMPTPLPGYDHRWHFPEGTPLCRYVYYVSRDDIFSDMFPKLAK